MSSIKLIKSGIEILPEKDKEFALNFLKNRKFQDLLSIVESNIYKIKKFNKEPYNSINIEDLRVFKINIEDYIRPLQLNENEEY